MIYQATRTHARNLAIFVTLYKSGMLLLSNLNDGKEGSSHAFISGLVGGYFVFGKETSINKQVRKWWGFHLNPVDCLVSFRPRGDGLRKLARKVRYYPSARCIPSVCGPGLGHSHVAVPPRTRCAATLPARIDAVPLHRFQLLVIT